MTFKIRLAVVLAALSLAVLPVSATVHGSTGTHKAHGKVAHVKIISDPNTVGAYKPKTITVHLGQRIVFSNASNAIHTVTADKGKAFDSGNIATGKSWTFTAKHVGVFAYHCVYHRSCMARSWSSAEPPLMLSHTPWPSARRIGHRLVSGTLRCL
ncbi:MAG: cupredoxin domain-containing protein [Chloroflexota bacterium]